MDAEASQDRPVTLADLVRIEQAFSALSTQVQNLSVREVERAGQPPVAGAAGGDDNPLQDVNDPQMKRAQKYLPTFEGNEKSRGRQFKVHLDMFDMKCRLMYPTATDVSKKFSLFSTLRGNAAVLCQHLQKDVEDRLVTYANFCQKMCNVFSPPQLTALLKQRFEEIRQGNLDLPTYFSLKYQGYIDGWGDDGERERGNMDMLVRSTIEGCTNKALRCELYKIQANDFAEFKQMAMNRTAVLKQQIQTKCYPDPSATLVGLEADAHIKFGSGYQSMEVNALQGGNGDPQQQGGARQAGRVGDGRVRGPCHVCGKVGHYARDCRSRAQGPAQQRQGGRQAGQVGGQRRQAGPGGAQPRPGGKKDVVCHGCGKRGHIRRDCRSPRQQQQQAGGQVPRGRRVNNIVAEDVEDANDGAEFEVRESLDQVYASGF